MANMDHHCSLFEGAAVASWESEEGVVEVKTQSQYSGTILNWLSYLGILCGYYDLSCCFMDPLFSRLAKEVLRANMTWLFFKKKQWYILGRKNLCCKIIFVIMGKLGK